MPLRGLGVQACNSMSSKESIFCAYTKCYVLLPGSGATALTERLNLKVFSKDDFMIGWKKFSEF